MKIVLVTPIYAVTTQGSAATPVVHYFTREWARMGHSVKVFNFVPRFPRFYYFIARLFQHQLNTRLGMLVPTDWPEDQEYEADGVSVCCRGLKKSKPHSRYSKKQIKKAVQLIEDDCEKNGVPDIFVGHWDNPQLEILRALKKRFNRPVCLVLHNNRFHLEDVYGDETRMLLSEMNMIGFRNPTALKAFESQYGKPKSSFLASSGVSQAFLDAGKEVHRSFTSPLRSFVFVGSLIARKYPRAIVEALESAFPDGDYKMTFIGDGAERGAIEKDLVQKSVKGSVVFTGRIPREQIIEYLKDADVFVMISKGEIFGLVYLEAMAMGVIPIGSRNEGIDGIIRDGINGFLCGGGDVGELSSLLSKMRGLSRDELVSLARNAKETAQQFSDFNVAKRYLTALEQTI